MFSDLHPALIAAIASRESGIYNPIFFDDEGYTKAENNDGYGMMQVMAEITVFCIQLTAFLQH